MKVVIDIPKEFESHFELDKFNESLCRLRTDIHCVAGKYEQELCDMLIEAFNNGTPLQKGHGRLIYADDVKENHRKWIGYLDADMIARLNIAIDKHVPTIIEGEKE